MKARRSTAMLLVTALLALPLPLRARSGSLLPAAEANAHQQLTQAVAAYEQLDFERSLSLLPASAGESVARPLAARMALYRGLSLFLLGRQAEARRAFLVAIARDPGLQVNPTEHKPSIVAFFRAALVASGKGTLQLSCDLAGAALLVDGRVVGRGRRAVLLPAGEHQLAARHLATGGLVRQRLVLGAGERKQVELMLRPSLAALELSGVPVGAQVYVGGQLVGRTPLGTIWVLPRQTQLRVRQDDGLGGVLALQPVAGATLSVVLERRKRAPRVRRRLWSWVAAGASSLALGGTVVLGLSVSTASDPRDGAARDALSTRAAATNGMLTTGLVFGAAAAVLYFAEGRSGERDAPELHLRVVGAASVSTARCSPCESRAQRNREMRAQGNAEKPVDGPLSLPSGVRRRLVQDSRRRHLVPYERDF